jgi:hypothetical protein
VVEQPLELQAAKLQHPIVLIPIQGWDRVAERAVRFGLLLSDDVTAIHVTNEEDAPPLRKLWAEKVEKTAAAAHFAMPHLKIIPSPYRRIEEPILNVIKETRKKDPDRLIAVVIPELVEPHWFEYVLHNLHAARLRASIFMLRDRRTVVISTPCIWGINGKNLKIRRLSNDQGYAATEPGETRNPSNSTGPWETTRLRSKSVAACHSDLSMVDSEWESAVPVIPGHELSASSRLGLRRGLTLGQRVGLGWFADSCLTCEWCKSGNHHLCASVTGTIIGRHGGFADRVRANAAWVIPLRSALNRRPLMCGGVTVFNPLLGRLCHGSGGIVGIGGLGHMALFAMPGAAGAASPAAGEGRPELRR